MDNRKVNEIYQALLKLANPTPPVLPANAQALLGQLGGIAQSPGLAPLAQGGTQGYNTALPEASQEWLDQLGNLPSGMDLNAIAQAGNLGYHTTAKDMLPVPGNVPKAKGTTPVVSKKSSFGEPRDDTYQGMGRGGPPMSGPGGEILRNIISENISPETLQLLNILAVAKQRTDAGGGGLEGILSALAGYQLNAPKEASANNPDWISKWLGKEASQSLVVGLRKSLTEMFRDKSGGAGAEAGQTAVQALTENRRAIEAMQQGGQAGNTAVTAPKTLPANVSAMPRAQQQATWLRGNQVLQRTNPNSTIGALLRRAYPSIDLVN